MSRWAYTNISFSDSEASDTEAEEKTPFLSVVAITEGSVAPDDPFSVRVYYWHPGSASIRSDSPASAPVTVAAVGTGTESVTETVALQWGHGNTQYPDLEGNTEVYDSAYESEPLEYKEVTYSAKYKDYDLSAGTIGNKQVAFYFGDKSAVAQASFTVDSETDLSSPVLSPVAQTQGDVAPDDPFSVRVYYWHPGSATIQTDSPSSAPVTVSASGSGAESVTETVALQWGRGNTQYPDTDGNTEVYDPVYESEPLEYKEVTYSALYADYDLSASTIGQKAVAFYFSDKSAIGQVSFNVTDASASVSPFLSPVAQTQGDVAPDDPFSVRVYYFHPGDATIQTDSPSSAPVAVSASGAGTESVTETVTLQWGHGNTKYPDTDGNTAVYDETYAGDPIEYKTVTYSALYKDYNLSSGTSGQKAVAFYFSDKSVTGQISFTVAEEQPEPEDKDVTVESLNYYSDAAVSGDSVYLDGSYMGTTNANGQLTLEGLTVGQSYQIKFVKSGYKDSDLDSLENDTFTVS